MHNDGLLKEAETMTEKSAFDKALGELHDLIEWEDAEAAIRELHARQPEMERIYLDGKILPGELQALVMVSNCLEREFIHRQLATGRPLHLNNAPNATRGWNRKKRRGEPWEKETIRHLRPGQSTSASASRTGRIRSQSRAMRASGFWMDPRPTSTA